jgi:hypothetical protein
LVGLATLVDTLVVFELVELAFGLLGIVWHVANLVVVPMHSIERDNVVRLVGKLVVVMHVQIVVLHVPLVPMLAFVLGHALVLELAPMRVLGLGLGLVLEKVLGLVLEKVLGLGLAPVLKLGLVLVLEPWLEHVFATRLVGRQLGK